MNLSQEHLHAGDDSSHLQMALNDSVDHPSYEESKYEQSPLNLQEFLKRDYDP